MSYSTFTIEDLESKFGVRQVFMPSLFSSIKPKPIGDWLKNLLVETVPFALMNDSEKARSEYIIAPVFFELRKQSKEQLSVFSGIEFNVDRKNSLTGECDFLVSRSDNQTFLEAPVVVAVEAKRQDFKKGYVQCIAEMIAARKFNEQRNKSFDVVYGCVTTGDAWRFLYLKEKKAFIDTTTFDLNEDLERILGILWAMSFGEIDK